MTSDKLQQLYEEMVEEEQKEIEKKNPTLIEQLLRRVEALEEQVRMLKG
jgi:hypothetical protein